MAGNHRSKTERIEAAALRLRGKVYSLPPPNRHHNIFAAHVSIKNGVVVSPLLSAEQGFITNSGRFVDRREALEIAVAAKQLIQIRAWGGLPELYSEDLW